MPFTIVHSFVHSISPELMVLVRQFITNEEKILSRFDDINTKFDEMVANLGTVKEQILVVIATEAQQVATAIADLKATVGDTISEEQAQQLLTKIDAVNAAASSPAVKEAVEAIFVPETPPAA